MDNGQMSNNIIKMILDMAQMLLLSGADSGRVEDTVRRLCKSNGLSSTYIFVIPSIIVLTATFEGNTFTCTRRINVEPDVDFAKLEELNELSRLLCKGKTSVSQAKDRLQIIEKNNNDTIRLVGSMLAALSFCVYFGGKITDAVLAGIIGIVVGFFQNKEDKFPNRIVGNFFCAMITGIMIKMIAVLPLPVNINSDAVMIGDIMLLVPGMSFTISIRDIINGNTISGAIRFLESIFWAGALALGFMISIWLFR